MTTLVRANVTVLDDNGKETEYNAYTAYFNSKIGDFFADAVELMYAAAMEEEDQLDRAYVLEMMEKFRKLDSDDLFAFVSLSANILYYDGISGLLTDSMSEAAGNVFNELLVVEELYANYISQGSTMSRDAFISTAESLKSDYTNLADKSDLADFEEMYNFYMAALEKVKAEKTEE
jgi:hypothetical protein